MSNMNADDEECYFHNGVNYHTGSPHEDCQGCEYHSDEETEDEENDECYFHLGVNYHTGSPHEDCQGCEYNSDEEAKAAEEREKSPEEEEDDELIECHLDLVGRREVYFISKENFKSLSNEN